MSLRAAAAGARRQVQLKPSEQVGANCERPPNEARYGFAATFYELIWEQALNFSIQKLETEML